MLTLYAVGVMHTNPPIHIIVVFVEDGKLKKKKKSNLTLLLCLALSFFFALLVLLSFC
jgi:hypothetical protein